MLKENLEEVYQECESSGLFRDQDVTDLEKIKTMMKLSEANLEFAQSSKDIDKNSLQWCVIYNLHYDALRELSHIMILFDRKKIANHRCLFSYLCKNHPELDFDWNFLEKIRTKRNGINYYGTPVTKQDFKEIELQVNLYIKTLKNIIKEKLLVQK